MFRTISKVSKYRDNFINSYRATSHQLVKNDEVCSYPPIIEYTKEGQLRHNRQLWYDSIKALPTVEQKLFELTQHIRPRQKRYSIPALPHTYNGIFFQRYITRTHLIDHLPEVLTRMTVDEEYDEIIDAFKETILTYYFNNWKCTSETYKDLCGKNNSSKLVNCLISHCYKKLALKNEYILESTIQQTPRLNSYWFHQGFHSKNDRLYERNLVFQYRDCPDFIIRLKQPLNPIVDLEDPLCATAEVPDYNYDPTTVGFAFDRKWITSVPGHWFDDPCEYPFLLVDSTEKFSKLLNRLQFYDINKIKDAVGMMHLFGWLNAAATYQGFTPFHDLTYPLVAQCILSNGQDWNFYIYQLNTIAFHEDMDKKDKRNICWSSGTMRLFESIKDGKFIGFNDDVCKTLLKFLLNAPLPQDNVIFKPYLGTSDMNEEDAKNMRFFYRRMYSQARDPMAYKNEIPTWQRIYVYSKHAKPMPFVKME